MPADTSVLWQPFQLGPALLRNRVFVSAHTTNFGVGNAPTDRHVAYHRERAAGGVALIITEGIRVHPTSAARDTSLGGYDDSAVPAFAALVDAVRDEGAAMFAQLLPPRAAGGRRIQPHRRVGTLAPALVGRGARPTRDDEDGGARRGRRLRIDRTPDGAGRVRRLGGPPGSRAPVAAVPLPRHEPPDRRVRRFAVGPAAIAARCAGRDLLGDRRLDPVGVRISADEFLPDGLGVADMIDVVGLLREEFRLAFVHVSNSAYAGSFSLATQMADMSFPPAPFRHFPAAFKATFPDLPVLAVCRFDDVETAAAAVSDGVADMVAMTRAHIADPALLRKVATGRREEVRSCLACNQGCIGRIEKNQPLSCVVNPEVGFEAEWSAFRNRAGLAPSRRRVLVVGAGPAGLQAAVTARRLGHDVVLAEADEAAGGQLRVAARLTGRTRLGLLVAEQDRDARAAGVEIRLGCRIGIADVVGGGWDALVVATGSAPVVTVVPGCHTLSPHEAVQGLQLRGIRTVAVFDEVGDWRGAGLAEHLAARGHHIYLLAPIAGLAWNITTYSRLALVDRLGRLGVRVLPLRRPVRGEAAGLVVADTLTGDQNLLSGVGAVVHAGPAAACEGLFGEIEGLTDAPPAVLVGDAYAPRTALEAVFEAQLAVSRLLTGETVLAAGGVGA